MGNANKDRWGWLRKGCLKRTIEALIMAAQEQALRPNNIKQIPIMLFPNL